MVKFKKYALFGLALLLIPFINVKADTVEKIGYITNNVTVVVGNSYGSNGVIVPVQTNQNLWNTSTFRVSINNYNIEANKNYILELYMTPLYGNNVKRLISSDKSCFLTKIDEVDTEYPKFNFYCTKSINNITFTVSGNTEQDFIFSTSTYRWNYAYLSYIKSDNSDVTNRQDVIINQNETIINQGEQTNDKLNDINDSLTSDELPNTDDLDNLVGFLPPGPVDSILNLPLSVLNSFLSSLNGECKSINIKLPFVKNNLKLPCMYEYLSKMTGFTILMDWISNVAGTILLIKYLVNLYNWIDNQTSLNDTNNSDWGGIS